MEQKSPTLNEKWSAVKLMVRWSWQTSPLFTMIILVITIVAGLIGIIEPYIFKLLIDKLVQNPVIVESVAIVAGGILLTYGGTLLAQQLLWDGQVTLKKVMVQRLERTVAVQMMKKISSLDAIYFENPEYYNTLQKANEQFWRINEFFWHITFCLGNLASVIVISVTFFRYSPTVAMLVLAGALPQMWASTKTTKVLWGAFDYSSPISREALYYKRLMTERAEAVKEVRLFNLSDFILNKFSMRIGDFIRRQDKAALEEFWLLVLITLTSVVFSIISAFLIVKSYINKEITLGTLTFLWALLFQFSNNVKWT
ncbi:MAG: ABC transporter transmembrane domain-containing protein, partial [Nanoarchaeota archaeon]